MVQSWLGAQEEDTFSLGTSFFREVQVGVATSTPERFLRPTGWRDVEHLVAGLTRILFDQGPVGCRYRHEVIRRKISPGIVVDGRIQLPLICVRRLTT